MKKDISSSFLAYTQIKGRIIESMVVLTIFVCIIAMALVFIASKVLTDPINHMLEVIRKVKRGRLDEQMAVDTGDELGELASAFNRMTQIIKEELPGHPAAALTGDFSALDVTLYSRFRFFFRNSPLEKRPSTSI